MTLIDGACTPECSCCKNMIINMLCPRNRAANTVGAACWRRRHVPHRRRLHAKDAAQRADSAAAALYKLYESIRVRARAVAARVAVHAGKTCRHAHGHVATSLFRVYMCSTATRSLTAAAYYTCWTPRHFMRGVNGTRTPSPLQQRTELSAAQLMQARGTGGAAAATQRGARGYRARSIGSAASCLRPSRARMGRGKWQWRSRDVPAVDPRRGLTTGRPARYPRLTRGLPVAPCSTRRMPFHECYRGLSLPF